MKVKPALRLLFAATILFCAGRVYAQTGQMLDEFGASCKSAAMGQAFTAVADDFSAAYYNPAGLTQIDSPFAFSMGYFYVKPRAEAIFDLRDDWDSNIYEQMSSHGVMIGIASSLDIASVIKAYPWFNPFAFGLVMWLNLPEMMQYHAGPEGYRPHFFRWDDRFALMSMVASVAYEVFPWLSVGAGAFVANKGYSTQDLWLAMNRGEFIPLPPDWVSIDPVKGSRVGIHQTAVVFAVPTAGILLKPPVKSLQDKISLGASWRGESSMHHGRGPLIINVGWERPDGDPTPIAITMPTLNMLGVVGFQPAQATVALAFKNWPLPLEGLAFSFDVTWKDYSKMTDYLDERPDPAFRDTWVPRVGIEYAFDPNLSGRWLKWIDRVHLRGGYFFEQTPAQDLEDPHTHNMYDTDMDVASGGLQVDFTSRQGRLRHSIEGFFQVHLLRERHTAEHVTSYDAGAASYFGPVTLSGEVYSFGMSITTRF